MSRPRISKSEHPLSYELYRSQDREVDIVTRLQAGRTGVRIPAKPSGFSLFLKVQPPNQRLPGSNRGGKAAGT